MSVIALFKNIPPRPKIKSITNNIRQYVSKTGFCEDLDEGKFSLPLIDLLIHAERPDRITPGVLGHIHEELMRAPNEVKERLCANNRARMLMLRLGLC